MADKDAPIQELYDLAEGYDQNSGRSFMKDKAMNISFLRGRVDQLTQSASQLSLKPEEEIEKKAVGSSGGDSQWQILLYIRQL